MVKRELTIKVKLSIYEEHLGVPPGGLVEVAGQREVWASVLRLQPPAAPDKHKRMD